MRNINAAGGSLRILHSILPASLLIITIGCQKTIDNSVSRQPETAIGKPAKMLKDFTQVNLVGSNTEYSPSRVDPLLVNAWGIVFSAGGTAWISAQGTGVSTIYNRL